MVASALGRWAAACQLLLTARAFVSWNIRVNGAADTSRWEMQHVSWWLLPWDHACQLLLKATAFCSVEHICGWCCRYQQMGNAACLMVASALGPCLSVVAQNYSTLQSGTHLWMVLQVPADGERSMSRGGFCLGTLSVVPQSYSTLQSGTHL